MSGMYEKEYFHDDYSRQFAEFRNCYRERTQRALQGRNIDRAPVPNATTVVFLHDEGDGTCDISTGDFVEYFNRCYGGADRIGAMRASLADALKKAEKSNEYAKQQRTKKTRSKSKFGIAGRVRSTGRRMLVSHLAFAMMLLLSLTVFFGSTLALNDANAYMADVESRVAAQETAQVSTGEVPVYLGTVGENTVEICETQEKDNFALSTLFNALINGR